MPDRLAPGGRVPTAPLEGPMESPVSSSTAWPGRDGAAPAAGALGARLRDLASLAKPRLASLVIVTAAGGAALAGEPAGTGVVAGAIVGTTLVVGGANALNNFIERDSDRFMARTRNRPLPAGRMAPGVALAFGLGLTAVALPLLAWTTTPLATGLAALASALYVLAYTPLKRRTSLATLVGAVPGALPPLIGWTAVTGRADLGGLVLFALLFLWQVPHSLAIGTFRQAEYDRAGLVVFPSEHGLDATRRQMLLYSLPLVVVPAVLHRLGVAGPLTLWIGTALGLGMVALCLDGLLRRRGRRHARRVFFFTLAHLTGLFATLALDAALLGA